MRRARELWCFDLFVLAVVWFGMGFMLALLLVRGPLGQGG